MTEWMQEHAQGLWWLFGVSMVTFVGSLIIVPIIVVRIPADYFAHEARHHPRWTETHPLARITLLIVKNVLGAGLLLGGLAMLVLPGQGLLTIAMGLMLLDFPGKYRLERWLVSRRPILRSVNWLRRRAGHPPLERPSPQ